MTRQFDQVAGDGRYLSPVADARITDLGPAVLRPARAPLTLPAPSAGGQVCRSGRG